MERRLQETSMKSIDTNLDGDAQHPEGEVLETGGASSEGRAEGFVGRGVPDLGPGVVQEEDLQVVPDGVSHQEAVFDDLVNFPLDLQKLVGCEISKTRFIPQVSGKSTCFSSL